MLCIRLNNAGKYCDRSTYRKCRFWQKKKHLFRAIIGPIFFENEQGEAITVNGDRYWAMLNEFLFTKIVNEDIGNVWFQQVGTTCHTAEALHSMFFGLFLKIALSAAELMSFGHLGAAIDTVGLLFVGCRKDKCYTDKPEIIDVLKDNIREAIGEIQMHTIDKVLKDWTDRVGYCMVNRGCHLNEIIFHY